MCSSDLEDDDSVESMETHIESIAEPEVEVPEPEIEDEPEEVPEPVAVEPIEE